MLHRLHLLAATGLVVLPIEEAVVAESHFQSVAFLRRCNQDTMPVVTSHGWCGGPSTVIFGVSYGVCVTIAVNALRSLVNRLVGASQ
jgi:hypothetical protein